MALENIEADNRESFCRFVLNRLDFLAEAYDLPVLESPDVAIAMLKGYTSRVLRKEYPHLKRMRTLWTPSYFVSSAGNVSAATIEQVTGTAGMRQAHTLRYIAEQTTKG
jgi:hypothetical protein